jgi:hypothetical protein
LSIVIFREKEGNQRAKRAQQSFAHNKDRRDDSVQRGQSNAYARRSTEHPVHYAPRRLSGDNRAYHHYHDDSDYDGPNGENHGSHASRAPSSSSRRSRHENEHSDHIEELRVNRLANFQNAEEPSDGSDSGPHSPSPKSHSSPVDDSTSSS